MYSKRFLHWWYLLCLGSAYPEPYLILYRNVSISILVIGTIEFFGATEGAVEVQEIKPTKVPGSLQIVGNICKKHKLLNLKTLHDFNNFRGSEWLSWGLRPKMVSIRRFWRGDGGVSSFFSFSLSFLLRFRPSSF